MGQTDTSFVDRALGRLLFWRRRADPDDYGIKGCFTLPPADPGPDAVHRRGGGPGAA